MMIATVTSTMMMTITARFTTIIVVILIGRSCGRMTKKCIDLLFILNEEKRTKLREITKKIQLTSVGLREREVEDETGG